jgi:spore maturation protein CgeB
MKIFIPRIPWVVDFHKFIVKGFHENQVEVITNSNDFELNKFIHNLRLHHILKIKNLEMQYMLRQYNKVVLNDCIRAKPDVFLIFNECNITPDTIKAIRERCGCLMLNVLGDDPWDSTRFVADFPHSLKYFDIIFNPEVTWSVNIRKAAPNALIYWHNAGFDPDYYFPVDPSTITDEDRKKLACDLSFTGTSYGFKSEGAYRSDVLSYISDFDLRIFGDNNWQYRFRYLPELRTHYYGSRLPMEELRKLYTLSKINLNIPAPQLSTCFQPRTFEIAATKGFQIIDNRSALYRIFSPDELVTFDTIPEFREKIRYYLDHDKERNEMTEKLYKKVTENFTWKVWAKRILGIISNSKDYELLEDELYPDVKQRVN